MNPALLNYLQSQDPESSQQMGNPSANQAPYNPFDQGIRKAIESAQESLGMTEKQQDKALRRSMLAFADNMSQQPKEKGFFNNFGAVSRSLLPAIAQHDLAEDESLIQNNALANQIIGHQRTEEDRLMKADEHAWNRDFKERQLEEQERYHDAFTNRIQQRAIDNVSAPIEGYLPLDTRSKNLYGADKKGLGTVLNDLTKIGKRYSNYREDYKNNIIDPLGPLSGIANPTKDFFAKFTNNEDLRKERSERNALKAELNKFVVSSEKELKGGVLGPRIIQMFKDQGIYPDLERDTAEDIEAKLKMMHDEIETNYKTSKLSLQYGIALDPTELMDFESKIMTPPVSPEMSVSNEIKNINPLSPDHKSRTGFEKE